MFRVQKASNYGSSTPAIARTTLQGTDILNFFQSSKVQKDTAKSILYELQRHLIKCVEIRDQVAIDISDGHAEVQKNGMELQAGGRGVTLPSVIDLQSKAETFLQSAKLAIAQTGELISPFYQINYRHKFHDIRKWAEDKFGASDPFVEVITHWEPFVKQILNMRNAVDHPSNKVGGKLKTENFNVIQLANKLELIDPTWGLSGEDQRRLLPEFDGIIENIIVLGEEILIALFYKLKSNFPLTIQEIPLEERNPSNPRRLIVGL